MKLHSLGSKGIVDHIQSEPLHTYLILVHIDLAEDNIRVFLTEVLQARNTHPSKETAHTQIYVHEHNWYTNSCLHIHTLLHTHTCMHIRTYAHKQSTNPALHLTHVRTHYCHVLMRLRWSIIIRNCSSTLFRDGTNCSHLRAWVSVMLPRWQSVTNLDAVQVYFLYTYIHYRHLLPDRYLAVNS